MFGGTAIEVLLSKSLSRKISLRNSLSAKFSVENDATDACIGNICIHLFLAPRLLFEGMHLHISLHFGMWFTLETGYFQPTCISLLLCTLAWLCNVIDKCLTYVHHKIGLTNVSIL